MSTGRQLISEVRSLNKLISGDNNITDRMIHGLLKKSASLLIKRETNARKLWNSPNIFTLIECLEMVPVPLSECSEYKHEYIVARSKLKIPQIAEGIFGLLVQSVLSIGRRKYDYANLDRFLNILSLGLKNTKKYFWIYDEYLYISDGDVEIVDVNAYFDEDFDPATYSSCGKKDSTMCVNPLDREFKIPSYLEKQLVDLVCDTLNKTYFRHIVDAQTNARDEEKS